MTAEQLLIYMLIPGELTKISVQAIGLKLPAFTYAESAWILAFFAAAIGWVVYQYRVEFRSALAEEKAQIEAAEIAKEAMLHKEFEQQLKDDEFYYWWIRNGSQVDAWRDEITGSGFDQKNTKEVTSPWG